MASFNKVILLGNLTRDPVIKYLPSGAPVCEFGLAVNRTWTDGGSGEKREAVTFVDCRAFGKSGETINQYMKKGRQLMIEGRLEYHQWEKDGQKRSKLDVFVEGFQFVGARREDGEGDAPSDRPAPAARSTGRGGDFGGRGDGGPRGAEKPAARNFEGVEGEVVDDEVPF